MLISRTLQAFTDAIYCLYTEGETFFQYTLFLFGTLAALYVVQTVYTSLTSYYSRVDSERIRTYLREYIMRYACKVQYKYIDSYDDFKQQVELIKSDTGELVAQSMQQIISALQNIITFVSLLIILMNVNIWIVVVLLIATVPALILTYIQKNDEYKHQGQWKKDRALMIRYYLDAVNLQPMNDVRFMGLLGYIKKKWRATGDRFIESKNAMMRRHAVYNSASDLLRNGVFIIVLIAVTRMIFDDPSLGLGLFLLVITSAQQFQKVATELFAAVAQIVGNIRYVEDFFSLEDLDTDGIDEGAKPIEMPEIVYDNVTFAYPNTEREVLHNISVRIPYGQKVGIVGANGSGKSTFISLLCGIYDTYAGEVRIGGKNIHEDISSARKSLSVVFQDFGKYEDTIRYNIQVSDMGKSASDEELTELTKMTGAYDLVMERKKKFDEILGTFSEDVSNISGGEWQKLALSRALYRDSAGVVVLDEPTAALDPIAEADLYRNFSSLTGDRTTLLISHRLGFTSIVDRILVFREGRIVEDGTHEELLANNSYYAEMYQAQAQWYQ